MLLFIFTITIRQVTSSRFTPFNWQEAVGHASLNLKAMKEAMPEVSELSTNCFVFTSDEKSIDLIKHIT